MEPAFAATVHKAQGRTIEHVILALSQRGAAQCDMSYEAIYVALSRVKTRESIRLLLCQQVQWESLSYITKLEPDQFVKDFFSGFVETGHKDGAKILDIDLMLRKRKERIHARRSQ